MTTIADECREAAIWMCFGHRIDRSMLDRVSVVDQFTSHPDNKLDDWQSVNGIAEALERREYEAGRS